MRWISITRRKLTFLNIGHHVVQHRNCYSYHVGHLYPVNSFPRFCERTTKSISSPSRAMNSVHGVFFFGNDFIRLSLLLYKNISFSDYPMRILRFVVKS